LQLATLLTVVVTLALPFTPLATLFDFRPLPLAFLGVLGGIVGLYITAAEIAKKVFYQRGNAA
jgi:Mg2+-importing ATPase